MDTFWFNLGILSGKLPFCHVFKQFFPFGSRIVVTIKIEFGNVKEEKDFCQGKLKLNILYIH